MSPNHLMDEKSLYLRQHANNPVDWYPWGKEAFEKASDEDKPIFLSIGYSTCHWCHVMARESFQDAKVAEVLNRSFVCIKVDREERPDIDSIYMTACQLLTGRGGWPLSIVMTPDRKPFFAASYIPRQGVPGALGIIELMTQLGKAWKQDRSAVLRTVEAVNQALIQFADRLEPQKLKGDEIDHAYQSLLSSFDETHTGFDNSPKFPTPHRLMFLIDHFSRTREQRSVDMALRTLIRMRESGLFDHVGFGFFRYSTDSGWHLPHFEKTLYDQAMMAMAYTMAFRATGDLNFREMAEGVFAYAERSLCSPRGLFYSAESADSEGKEGKFYLWGIEELMQVLDPSELGVMKRLFDLRDEGNFLDEATQIPNGLNLLDQAIATNSLAMAMDMDVAEARRAVRSSLSKMFDAREKRVHPDKDDKVLTDWNGLMIAALAKAATTFGEPRYLAMAQRAIDSIWLKMQHEGRLYHRLVGGAVAIDGFLDDYAYFIWGLLETYRASYERVNLDRAVELSESVLKHFSDSKGGFFQTEDSAEEMIVRLKEDYDGAIPSGNSVMAMNLVALGTLNGESKYSEAAKKTFEAFAIDLAKSPSAYIHLISAYAKSKGNGRLLAIIGKEDATSEFSNIANRINDPDLEVIRYDNMQGLPEKIDASIGSRIVEPGPMAFLCSMGVCSEPVYDPNELGRLISLSLNR